MHGQGNRVYTPVQADREREPLAERSRHGEWSARQSARVCEDSTWMWASWMDRDLRQRSRGHRPWVCGVGARAWCVVEWGRGACKVKDPEVGVALEMIEGDTKSIEL